MGSLVVVLLFILDIIVIAVLAVIGAFALYLLILFGIPAYLIYVGIQCIEGGNMVWGFVLVVIGVLWLGRAITLFRG